MKKPIPAINSPIHKQIQQKSAYSTTPKERNSGISGSQNWPNKPKRVYEVIPSLTSDSRKTSRQSSVVGPQNEQIKIIEIQSPQSPTKTNEKSINKLFHYYFINNLFFFKIHHHQVFNFVVNIIMDQKLKKLKYFQMIQKIVIVNQHMMK